MRVCVCVCERESKKDDEIYMIYMRYTERERERERDIKREREREKEGERMSTGGGSGKGVAHLADHHCCPADGRHHSGRPKCRGELLCATVPEVRRKRGGAGERMALAEARRAAAKAGEARRTTASGRM